MLNQNIRHLKACSVIFALALITGCSAAALGPASLQTQVRSAVTKGNVMARLDGTTVVLNGQVDSLFDRDRAVAAAKRYEGVEKVVDRIFIFGD